MKKLYIIFTSILIISCASSKQDNFTLAPTTAEYYHQFQSNIDRLFNLLQGEFVVYQTYMKKDSSLYPATWKVNDKNDSMLVNIIPVGSIHREGYWLFEYQYLSNLPDMPIHCEFVHLSTVDRDTFKATYYKSPSIPPLKTLESDPNDFFNNIDLEKLKESGAKATFWKAQRTEFNGISNRYINDQKGKSNQHYRQDQFKVIPKYVAFIVRLYDGPEPTGKFVNGRYPHYLMRLNK